MHFTIRSQAYVVEIAARPLLLDGQPCRAKVDHDARRILLSDQLPREDRRKELFHELRHCWIEVLGQAAAGEPDADQAAEMMDAIFEQYASQGGDAALSKLDPSPDRTRRERKLPSGPLTRTRHACGRAGCECAVPIGIVENHAPQWNAEAGCWTMERGFCCPVCDAVTVWTEACAENGMPLGEVLAFPPPRVLEGIDELDWIGRSKRCHVLV